MTILCATDFSQPADDAVRIAFEIARKRGEKLLLWHAVQPQMGDPIAEYTEPQRAQAAARLESEAEWMREDGVTVTTEAVIGWPDQLLAAGMPDDTTLIVAGARGHARGTHWVIGTVVERIARIATVPLLVVREAEKIRRWLSGDGKLDVIVATDLSAVADFALRRASILKALGPCNLELLYVEYPPTEYARLGMGGPVVLHRPEPLIEDVLSRELSRRAQTVNLGGDVTTRTSRTVGQTSAIIALEAGDMDADLVVVGAHQRKALSRLWHGSIAHGVLHSAETNVLVVPFHTADEDIRALEAPPLTTIVAATDASPGGNRAVAWACTTAKPGSHVVIVSVVGDEDEAEQRSVQLEQIKASLRLTGGTRADTVVTVSDDTAATICATAERTSADMIIVGRQNRSRLGQLFLGSVSGELLTRSRRPVLVVPDPGTL